MTERRIEGGEGIKYASRNAITIPRVYFTKERKPLIDGNLSSCFFGTAEDRAGNRRKAAFPQYHLKSSTRESNQKKESTLR